MVFYILPLTCNNGTHNSIQIVFLSIVIIQLSLLLICRTYIIRRLGMNMCSELCSTPWHVYLLIPFGFPDSVEIQ